VRVNHWLKMAGAMGFAGSLMTGAAQAQADLLTLRFSGPTPPAAVNPGQASAVLASLVLGNNGTFYGVDFDDVVFAMSSQGTLTSLYSFFPDDIAGSVSPLTLASDGNLYGTTHPNVAISGNEIVFQINPAGALTTIYTTNVDTDVAPPCIPQFDAAGLIQGNDGNLYGVGIGGENGGVCTGTVFKVTLGGTLAVLHTFQGSDGTDPEAALTQGSDGNLYGTTSLGGADNLGTVFQITPAGAFTTLHSFVGTDGAMPLTPLVQGKDGNLYGTSSAGGSFNLGTIFSIAPSGAMSVVYSFTGQADGENPNGLTLGTDGNFYGTTQGGGESNCTPPDCQAAEYGTIFVITPGGTLTTLYTFDNGDGRTPQASLVQGPDGNFYGSTSGGGLDNVGTLFKISTGLETASAAIAPPPIDVQYTRDGEGNAVVSWSAVPGATSYNVYAGSGTPNIPTATSTTNSVTIPAQSTGTDVFKVAWVNASGTSGLSAVATSASKSGGGVLELWMLVALSAMALIAISQRCTHIRRRNID
jgi:uncharacterized repeat protein (TIGR03803 family)